jgi:glycosyltransferase involved in cell wall biosynthesis
VAVIGDWNGPYTGIGRYWRMLQEGLERAGISVTQTTPFLPEFPDAVHRGMRWLGRDLQAFLTNYPLWCPYPDADVYHLGQQSLASLLLARRPRGKVVVTVHDIFPHILQNDWWFWLSVAGLKRADHLIAISHYTKRTLIEYLGIAPERIAVVHHGMDHGRFRPMKADDETRRLYGLAAGRRYLLYVGSEDPRKDLVTLVRALAKVRSALPDVELIKAGRSHCAEEREHLLQLAGALNVLEAIHFLEDVPEDHLPRLYGAAELFVTPSPYEGFCFPLLEAMACGTPAVYAAAGSLPEIAAGTGRPVRPGDVDSLTTELLALLQHPEQRSALSVAGRERASAFTWPASTERVLAVYAEMLSESARPASQSAGLSPSAMLDAPGSRGE